MAHRSRTYTLSGGTLDAGQPAGILQLGPGIDIFEVGPTDLEIKFSGIENTDYKYLKFLVDYGDGTDIETVQHTSAVYGSSTDISDLSAKSINHTFYPAEKYIKPYTVSLSGIRTDLQMDRYRLNVKIGKQSICAYKDMKIINSYLYTTEDGVNNLMLTVELQNPRFVGNIIVPQDKIMTVYDDLVGAPIGIERGIFLRTELYTKQGGRPISLQSIVTELYTPKGGLANIITEDNITVIVIGTEGGDQIIINVDDHMEMQNINGDTVNPIMILIPEYSEDEFNSDFADPNVIVEGLEYH